MTPTPGIVVRTVLGPVAADVLGPTLVHEHLLIDNPSFVEPEDPTDRARAHRPLALEDLGWVRRHWTSHADNLVLDDEAMAIAELAPFAAGGGATIVDATVPGIGRDPLALARIPRASGVHIVMGAGAYIAPTHPPDLAGLDADAIAERWIAEWHDGVDGTGIRPGFFGEIGCSWPLADVERTALKAAARAQRATGAALMVHPGRDRTAPGELVRLLEAQGVDPPASSWPTSTARSRTPAGCWSLPVGGRARARLLRARVVVLPVRSAMATLSDAQRLDLVRTVVDAGYLERVVLSHDICTEHRLAAFGGHGYGHLLGEVVPWMWQRGFTAAETAAITVDNPARLFGVAA